MLAEDLIGLGEQTVEEARRFYGVEDTTSALHVPEGLEEKVYDRRRKRAW